MKLLGGDYRLDAWKEDFRQGRYNRQALERRKRMDPLQWLIDHTVALASGEERAFHSPLDILRQQHGARCIRHPAARQQLDFTRLLLDSLVHDALVESDRSAGFRVSPVAIGVVEVTCR
ncbi:hypothetical protein [Burkholderia ubonensis]|uniref:hypothetical protein n=1 Tax=Burkholderia ubonensis TaxID=101571 RepID=UPI000755A22D|nr:hypothetical protein [Burkholderia ubonensis]AOI68725.1 hypothetical protein WI31_03590 [Burkholderia ubonensis]KUZ17406.1 hypothetical protein WI29_17920 [Burkholderia ubonensis]KUZ31182.1 hypothetical protein WI32_00945 [Burkholderia ubonensis]KUZ37954.1 hypothetical protein WI30_04705 [Burkholderia ubonensis]KUZ39954.1 hypothetical protein WI33_34420 [Burkholderia ubonensis]